MNRKYFEIFKKYRGRKYSRDLDKLQEDFASRGLISSGIRNKEEARLKADYEDEISMKGEETAIYYEQRRERTNSIWINRILASVAILSFLATIYYADKNFQAQYRPYLAFEGESTDFSYLIGVDENNHIINDDKVIISTKLSNTGIMPAKFEVTKKTNGVYNNITWIPRSVQSGIIAPNQNILLSWQVEWNTDSQTFKNWRSQTREMLPIGNIAIEVDYSPINRLGDKHFTILGSKVVLDEKKSLDRNSEVVSGKFDWFIVDMD